VAHRCDYDLRQHALHSGWGDRLQYRDPQTGEAYFPHVIEPSAGVDRGVLALLCEAYTVDEKRPSGLFLRFSPRIAPIKAAIFSLIDREDLNQITNSLFCDLSQTWMVQKEVKQHIGKRYARMDEVGTPY